ncbi:MAG: hypothetical protein H0X39_10025, partial [Actinobacteria bacterium]|nr:hypothetical protein [Actinomycetota bacterium]
RAAKAGAKEPASVSRVAVSRPAPAAHARHLPVQPRQLVKHAQPAAKTRHPAHGNGKQQATGVIANGHRAAAAMKVAAHRAAIARAKIARAQKKLAKQQQRVSHVKAVHRANRHASPHRLASAKKQK